MDLCNDVKNKQVSREQQSEIRSEMGGMDPSHHTVKMLVFLFISANVD